MPCKALPNAKQLDSDCNYSKVTIAAIPDKMGVLAADLDSIFTLTGSFSPWTSSLTATLGLSTCFSASSEASSSEALSGLLSCLEEESPEIEF